MPGEENIQIQPMLRLNVLQLLTDWTYKDIQIQPMLRLNGELVYCNCQFETYSNTTNVKVKS